MTDPGPTVIRLCLFVAGGTTRAEAAIARARELVRGTAHDLEVVDVVADPDRAESDRVLATPCLDRVDPPPRRRVIGDLTDLERIASILGLPRTNGLETA